MRVRACACACVFVCVIFRVSFMHTPGSDSSFMWNFSFMFMFTVYFNHSLPLILSSSVTPSTQYASSYLVNVFLCYP